LAASAGVFLHAGIKFPWFVFFQKDSGMRPSDPPWNMKLAMVLFAALCIGLGIWPQYLYDMLPYPVDYEPYTVAHVVNMLQLLMFSGFAFFLMLPFMKRTLTITLDFDWFYRKLGGLLARSIDWVLKVQSQMEMSTRAKIANSVKFEVRHFEPRSRPIGTMAVIMLLIFVTYLVFSILT
jgi:multicomponent Na+:H+ antiporter subunit D